MEVRRPRPGAGEVLVRVRAAGIERGTVHLMNGLPRLVAGRSACADPQPYSGAS